MTTPGRRLGYAVMQRRILQAFAEWLAEGSMTIVDEEGRVVGARSAVDGFLASDAPSIHEERARGLRLIDGSS